MANVQDLVQQLVCLPGGQVYLRLDDRMDDATDVTQLFPLETLLVIRSDVFGDCHLQPHRHPSEPTVPDEEEQPLSLAVCLSFSPGQRQHSLQPL